MNQEAAGRHDESAARDVDRLVAEAYDRVADTYDEGYTSAMHKAENVALRTVLIETALADIPHFPHPSQDGYRRVVLDLGCGTGLLLDILPELTPYVVGLDVSQRMVERASQKHADAIFRRGNMADLAEFDSGSFAAVTSLFGPLSFCSDHVRASQEIRRVLMPGGRFFVMACGTRYATRKTYQQQGYKLPMTYFTGAALRDLFGWARRYQTRPFNVHVEDNHSHRLVSDQVAVLLNEWNSFLRADSGYQVVIHGQK